MVPYYGDYPEDHTEIRIPFNTFDSNDPSASVTITNLADADIEVHADGDTTPIATDGASVIIDFAGETGSHMILIDSSADAAYTTGTEYAVKIVGTTVDSATVNAWVGTFSIERAGGVLAFLKAEVGTAGVGLSNINLPETGLNLILKGSTHTLAVADAVWDEVLTGATHNVASSAGRRLRQLEQVFVLANGTIATATNGHTFTLDTGAVATADYYIGARLQITEGTGLGQSRLIKAYSVGRVALLDSDFTVTPDNASLYEVVAADVHVSLSDADLASGFVTTATSTTTLTLDTGAVATTDYYVGEMIVFTHGTGAGQAREITAYTSGRVVTMSPALVTAVSTDTVWHIAVAVSIPEIVDEIWDEAQSDHTTAGSMGEIATETAAILVDTGEIGTAGAGLSNINLPNQTMDITGDITGDLSGSVGSVTGAVGSVTGAVGSVAGNVDGSTASIANGGIVAATFAAGAVDAAALATDAVDEISDGTWNEARSGHSTAGTYGESYIGVVSSTAAASGTTTNVTTNLTEATSEHYTGRTIVFITGALAGQGSSITAYDGSTKALTVTAMTEAAASTDQFVIV